MGIFSDMLLAAGLRRHDQHVNHISNSLFGSLPEKGRCILCGGVDSGEFSNAKQIKLHAFSSRLQRAARKSLPTLCLYSGTLPSEGPDAAVRQLREQYPDKVVRLGQDISYLPFDRNVDVEDAMRILSGPVHIYVQKAQASPGEILSFLRTMLQLLHEHWPPEMFTFSNLDIMMQSFGKNAAEFLSTLPPDAVQQAEHSLNLSWSTGVDGFWKAFRSQCAVLGPPGVRRRSLYSCLADGKLCVLCSPPAGQEMLTASAGRDGSFSEVPPRLLPDRLRRFLQNAGILFPFTNCAGADAFHRQHLPGSGSCKLHHPSPHTVLPWCQCSGRQRYLQDVHHQRYRTSCHRRLGAPCGLYVCRSAGAAHSSRPASDRKYPRRQRTYIIRKRFKIYFPIIF